MPKRSVVCAAAPPTAVSTAQVARPAATAAASKRFIGSLPLLISYFIGLLLTGVLSAAEFRPHHLDLGRVGTHVHDDLAVIPLGAQQHFRVPVQPAQAGAVGTVEYQL